MSPKQNAYDVITGRIIAALEEGVVPWRKPWRSVRGELPSSLSTGKPYRGINVWLLSLTAMAEGYTSPWWGTYEQIAKRGGQVRKGEQHTKAILFKRVEKKSDVEGEKDKSFAMLKYFRVFNVDQADWTGEKPGAGDEDVLPEHDPIESAEAIASGYTAVEVKTGGNRAYYSPALDYIQMPERGQFDTVEHYYGTLFHEFAHSTGHESRLARPSLIKPTPFGTEDYSKEELVAEMAAAFVCGEADIEPNVEHHAGYIASWLKVLKNDNKMVVQAAKDAQKASDLVLGIEGQEVSAK